MSKKHRYAWDTSVFLAWLNKEKSAPLADIDVILQEIYSGKAVLIVSVTTYTEVVRAKHSQKQVDAFDGFLNRSNVLKIDATFPIAHKAEQIRSRALKATKKANQRKIKTPDATIIASAIIHRADVLHSMEPRHHQLSESSIVDGLKITPPQHYSGQMGLEFE